MVSKKVTITLKDDQLEAVRKLVDARIAESVSGFVQHAVAISLNDVAGWGAMLGRARNAEPIVTSDPRDLLRLDPKARLILV